MGGYELSPDALADVQAIWLHIAADREDAADSWNSTLFAALECSRETWV